MTKHLIQAVLISLLCAAGKGRADDNPIEIKAGESGVKASVDYGQIVHGYNSETGQDYNWQVLRRSNIAVTRGARLGEHMEINMGFGGVFFYVLPEQGGAPHTRLPKFGVGPVQAEFAYHFGDPENSLADLQLGIFQYKYNPDASNLGEYLLRSGTYPGFLVTGGFNLINSTAYQVNGAGLTFNLFQKNLKLAFLLPMENQFAPMHSISPTFVATAKMIPGVELGAGIDCNHCIAAKPSQESPAVHTTDDPSYMHWPTSYILEAKKIKVADASQPSGFRDSVSVIRDTTQFYTFQGIKLMSRISIDPKAIFGLESHLNTPDLRVFAEMAVLGVKDYPFYYTDISRRIPIMFGMNLPTFKLLDILSVQGEYYNSMWTNDIDAVFELQRPVPAHQDYDPLNGPETEAARAKRDNWHWSVYGKKSVSKAAAFYLQVANDHTRPFDYNIKPAKSPITTRLSDFYYIFRIEVGI
ncbi:MAG: hypothetical protein JWO30_2129 [Fibrobacteres bacterium]|nr:hypothetical protein [Fibrobacterota bacterium]